MTEQQDNKEPIFLYNTLGREKQEFKPMAPGLAKMYACGPTVYHFVHIGNMRTYLFTDFLRRMLTYNGYQVSLIMNITDVGHLTDDADAGEDKMLVAMQREGKSAEEIAGFYTEVFFDDLKRLNVLPADFYPRATDHITQQINMIQLLEGNGYTYETSDGIYFDTSKLDEYGKLSGQKAEEKEAGARVDMKEKKNPTDFALWKFSPEDEKRLMEWESPWGKGFPGWHIECSAMSVEYLDAPFDIHTGGIDLIPVHHENEIAQTKGAHDTPQANYWMHGEFITVDGEKMSKSKGNVYRMQDLIDKGFDPLAYRYLVMGAHYRTKLNFTFEALESAQTTLFKLRDKARDMAEPTSVSETYQERFHKAVNDDLNMPQALAVLWEMMDDDALASGEKAATLLDFDEILGLQLDEVVATPLDIPPKVQEKIDAREAARNDQDWETADALRDEIRDMGYLVEDTAEGPHVRVLSHAGK
jgi:cysteinyl-tRNA synthetase